MITLVSMPWMSARMPSIQLGMVHALLRRSGYDVSSRSANYQFADLIGFDLYDLLSGHPGPAEEWIFSSAYFEGSDDFGECLKASCSWAALGDPASIGRDLQASADAFLTSLAEDSRLQSSRIIGFTVTIAQLGSSIALAKRLRQHAYDGWIIFGGSACDGPAAAAMLECFPEIDVVYQGRANSELIALVEALQSNVLPTSAGSVVTRLRTESPDGQSRSLPGANDVSVSIRRSRSTGSRTIEDPVVPDYDEFFRQLVLTPSADLAEVWLPAESSSGCWWGERMQCTFCGLAPDMTYQTVKSSAFVRSLAQLSGRYGRRRFFMVDLIMPPTFLSEVVPLLRDMDVRPEFFFEARTSLSRDEFFQLVAAGVVWMQPGIESLADGPLRRMRKGTTIVQNLQVLRWAQEFGVRLSWNLLFGHPGDAATDYEEMLSLVPLLHHLPPPSGLGSVHVHRFSPLFDDMGGSRSPKLHPPDGMRHAFPVGDSSLRELIYKFDIVEDGPEDNADVIAKLRQAVNVWKGAYMSGAALRMADGHVVDSRGLVEHRLSPSGLGTRILEVATSFISTDDLSVQLGADSESFREALAELVDRGLVVVRGKRVMSLVLDDAQRAARLDPSPHAYLDV